MDVTEPRAFAATERDYPAPRSRDPRSPSRSALLLFLVMLCFATTRSLILRYPEGRQSTSTEIFAQYGFEAVSASAGHMTVYDVHANNASKAISDSSPIRPGVGIIEYPPLAISWMAVPVTLMRWRPDTVASISDSLRRRYATVTRIELALIDVFCLCLLALVLRRWFDASASRIVSGAAAYVLGGALLFVLIYDRMDLVVGALLLGAIALLLTSWPVACSLFLLAVAINFKIVAILVAPVWVIGSLECGVFRRRHRDQLAALMARGVVLTMLVAVTFVPYLLRDGRRTLDFLKYHAARGIQIESLVANAIFLLRPLGLRVAVEWEYGSTDVVAKGSGSIIVIATLAMALILACAVWRMWREVARASVEFREATRVAQAFPALIARYCVLFLVIGMCGAKVFSPQYLLWLLPLAPLVILEAPAADRTLQELMILVYFLTMLIFPLLYAEVRPHSRLPSGAPQFYPPTALGLSILTARNVVMLWLAVFLWNARSPLTLPRPNAST